MFKKIIEIIPDIKNGLMCVISLSVSLYCIVGLIPGILSLDLDMILLIKQTNYVFWMCYLKFTIVMFFIFTVLSSSATHDYY